MTRLAKEKEVNMASNGSKNQTETWLDERGITLYEFKPKLSFSQIDRDKSLNKKQGRYAPVDEDHGVIVAAAMEEHPERVGPLVCLRLKNGKYLVIDGNHRWYFGELLLGLASWPAYVITEDVSPFKLDMLLITANADHGKPFSMEERLAHAVHLVETYSVSQADAAKQLGIPHKRVSVKFSMLRADRRFQTLGMRRQSQKLGSSAKVRLASLRSDDVMKAATDLILEARLNSQETGEFVAAVNKARSEKEQLEVVEAAREKYKPEVESTLGGQFAPPRIIVNLRSTLKRIERLDITAVSEERERIEGAARHDLKLRVADAMQKLVSLQEVL